MSSSTAKRPAARDVMLIAMAFDRHRIDRWTVEFRARSWTDCPGTTLVEATSSQALAELAPDVIVGNRSPFIFDYLRTAQSAPRWLHVMSTGLDGVAEVVSHMRHPPRVSHGRGTQTDAITEYAIAMLLLLRYRPYTNAGAPAELPYRRQLAGQVLLVVGAGDIGSSIALSAKSSLRMRTVGAVRRCRQIAGFDDVVSSDGLPRALSAADVCINALPGGVATRDFYDARRFAMMKPGAFFINVGRGESVDEDALMAALRSGRLAGAALDVTQQEPLPLGHALRRAPNIVLTPHIAGRTTDLEAAGVALFHQNLRAFLADGSLVTEASFAVAP
jgi:D-2-hydroxyacid dehydrogenase (NADP+)